MHSILGDVKILRKTSISPPPPQRTGSSSSLQKSGHVLGHSHRSSLAENLRGLPPSPRNQRHPSFTQAALQELLNHPPAPKQQNPRFAGRDWRDVAVGELVSKDDVSWVELDTSVQDATMVQSTLIHQYRFIQLISNYLYVFRRSSRIPQATSLSYERMLPAPFPSPHSITTT